MRRGTGWLNFVSYQGSSTQLDYLKEQIGDIDEVDKSSIHENKAESDVSTLVGSELETMQVYVGGMLKRLQKDIQA